MGIYCNAGLHPLVLNVIDGAVKVIASLVMNTEILHAASGKGIYIPIRVHNHKVSIQRFARPLGYSLHYRKSIGYIGNKEAIHYIQMKPVCSPLIYQFHALIQLSEICGEHGWCQYKTHI